MDPSSRHRSGKTVRPRRSDSHGRRSTAYESKAFVGALFFVIAMTAPLVAQAATDAAADQPVISTRKIFMLLFLMLGPVKILAPFVNMTKGSDAAFRRRLATRAILLSAAALAVAGSLGRGFIENFNISVPVLAVTGGIVLFLVALQTVLQQVSGAPRLPQGEPQQGLHLAFNPLAFPIIVTPYGIAAVIVFAALLQDYEAKLMLAGAVLLILALDWVAMLFADTVLKWAGTALQIFAVVLGVTQIALGLQIIMHNLALIGVFVERAN